MRKIVFVGVLSIIVFNAGRAQDGIFVASVDPPRVAAGEQFTVIFQLSGTEMTAVGNFKAPDFGRFVLLSGPGRADSLKMVNGRTSVSLSLIYSLYAGQPGKYEIRSATIEYKGKVLKTDPIRLEVVAAGKGSSQAQRSAKQGPVDADIGNNLFLRAVPTKSRVRQGEQFVITYKLYMRVNISNFPDIVKVPTYEGFWAEDFEQPQSAEVTTETYDGKPYRVVTIKNTALFATQPGSLKISPLEVRCAVQVRRRNNDPFDIFNDPFSRAEAVPYDIKSNSLTIVIDPLPGKAPESFLGSIGTYTFGASLDKSEVKAGDPLTLKLTVSGMGNIRLLSIPKPAFPNDLETYEPRISEEISRDNRIIRGKKVAEYLLIPRNAGQRVIEPIAFTFYDLQKNNYVTLRSPRFEITITPGREPSSTSTGGLASKEEVRLLGEDIRFVKLDLGGFNGEDTLPVGSLWFWIDIILPPLLFIGTYAYRKRKEAQLGNISNVRSQKAGREAARRLKIAQKILAQGNTESYHAEVSRALFSYVSDKLRIPVASVTLESTAEALTRRAVPSDVIRKMTSCIERAEFARFAPGSDTKEARRDLLESAKKAIEDLEDSLNGKT